MIDLRSDTMTLPTREMRRVMSEAPVGDDVFGEDPSVNELQEYAADFLGKEAALFVPSGTMGNQICVNIHTQPGDEVIIEEEAHIFYYETGAPALLSGLLLRTLPSDKGAMNPDSVRKAVRPDIYYFPRTALICIENTHNRHSGAVIPMENIIELKKIADERCIKYHCDGARIWNAATALNIEPNEIAKHFDTLSVCLSKALGAPVGSLIAGSKEHIKKALKFRKILGGGMRQAGIIAAAGLYAFKNHYKLLEEDHRQAKEFSKLISESDYIDINPETIQTNIVVFSHSEKFSSEVLFEECKRKGVLIIPVGKFSIRCVFYFQISRKDMLKAAQVIKDSVSKLMKK